MLTLPAIKPLDAELDQAIRHKIDLKTKPVGALGQLEAAAFQIARVQKRLTPSLNAPHIVVFTGDHGIATAGVSKYPQAVTYQMVINFAAGGAAINVFANQHHIELKIVDAGVIGAFAEYPAVLDRKVAEGTAPFHLSPAMTAEQCETALEHGTALVKEIAVTGCNVIGFGEMGIGNTSAASMLMHTLTGIPLADCVGRGTGLDDEQVQRKLSILQGAAEHHQLDASTDPIKVLQTFGGFEIAEMCGAMLQAAAEGMIVLVDGFIATSAFLVAHAMKPAVLDYAIFCHQSDESGHKKMLDFLGGTPLLKLDLRLGEGTGAAVAYPLLQSAVGFLNDMASFESAGVSQSDK